MVSYRRETRRRPVILLVVITSLVLITLDSRGNGVIDTFRNTARDAIHPVQNLADSVFSPVQDAVDGVTGYGSLKDQNVQLKRQIADLRGKLAQDRAVGSDASELQKLLDLPTIADATGIAVRVIGGSPGNFERTVVVNKGVNQGVIVGLPVVAGAGLVGKVTDATSTEATVTLIDNPGFGVGVRMEKTESLHGITQSHAGDRTLQLTFLSNLQATISVGELVFTAAVSGAAFPPDIPVAKVTSVGKPKGNLEPNITLQPLVNLDDLTYLKVLRPQGGSNGQTTPTTQTP